MEEYANKQTASARARAEAVKRLQALHYEEWQNIYSAERIRHGLTPERSVSVLEEENRKLRFELEQLRDP